MTIDGFERVTAGARRVAEGIGRTLDDAWARTYSASSPGGEVTVIVDGRPRVRSVEIDPAAMWLEPVALEYLVLETVNTAVRLARVGSGETLLDGLAPGLRAAVTAAIAEARRIEGLAAVERRSTPAERQSTAGETP